MNAFILFRLFIFVFYFLFLPGLSWSQVKPFAFGKVTDSKTGEPLISANVYLSNTFTGADTDKDGEYIIRNIKPGTYKLIVSYIGYDSQSKQVRFDRNGGYNFNFKLTPKTLQFAEIVVEGEKPKNWDRNLNTFTRHFLGNSDFSEECKILNPFVMGFFHDKKGKYFEAVAVDMIIIENKALGYILHYSLQNFTVNRNILNYWGEPYFEKMIPKNEKELRRWNENREKAYLGSIRHFLKSLVDSTTIEEGFEMSLMDALPPDNFNYIPIKDAGLLFKKMDDNEYELKFNDFMKVVYPPGKTFQTTRRAISAELFPGKSEIYNLEKTYPVSYMVIKRNPVLFDGAGILFDPFTTLPYDAWANYRVARLLPREYKPGGK